LSASWSISALGQRVTCTRAGATSVSVRLHSPVSGVDAVFSFDCTSAQDTTPPIPVGMYDVTLTLRAADGAPLTEAPTQAAIAIASDEVTAASPVVFLIPDRGQLVLSFAALATTSNCASADRSGTGLTGVSIGLEHPFAGCAAVTFTRRRGGVTVGTYTPSCSSPPVTSCIERDETLTADSLESGPYAIHVSGLVAALPCWVGNDVLSVPAGAIATRRIELEPQHVPGC
jgi:hypothetical protein